MATLTQQINNDSVAPNVTKIDQKIEVTIFPVADVDRAKALYLRLGWRLDADFSFPGLRIVQVTPHGSACSLQFGTNLTAAAPGRARGTSSCPISKPPATQCLRQGSEHARPPRRLECGRLVALSRLGQAGRITECSAATKQVIALTPFPAGCAPT